MNSRFKVPFLVVVSLTWTIAAMAAETITGTVRNETTGRSAVDDEVVLRLGEGMQEETRTKATAQGAFTLNVVFPNHQHLVRVLHQGVNYDQTVSGAAPLQMVVYDAVSKIPGLSGKIGIAQMESDGKVLKVTEMYAITNSSNPPVTQARPDNFEVSVPEIAAFEAVEVRSGRGMWVKIAPVPVKGKEGKYGINFPMRPGDTLFKFVYHLPYQAPTTLHLKLPYPITCFGVMHPPSMSFKAVRPDAFTSPGLTGGLRVEQAVTTPLVGDVPAFEISGVGKAPEHAVQASTTLPTVSAPPGNPRAASPTRNPPFAADQSRTVVELAVGEVSVILFVGAFMMWRKRKRITG